MGRLPFRGPDRELDKESGLVAPAIESASEEIKAKGEAEIAAEPPADVLDSERAIEERRHLKEPLGGD